MAYPTQSAKKQEEEKNCKSVTKDFVLIQVIDMHIDLTECRSSTENNKSHDNINIACKFQTFRNPTVVLSYVITDGRCLSFCLLVYVLVVIILWISAG